MAGSFVELKIKRLTETARMPTRGHPWDAGIDLHADTYLTLDPGGTERISTGLAMEIPEGFCGLIWDRSGLATEGVFTLAGLLDSGYRGPVDVVLHNARDGDYWVERGNRIAQLLILPVPEVRWVEVKALSESARGPAGFGSTGRGDPDR
jgi:dUTP pyrophosphatase